MSSAIHRSYHSALTPSTLTVLPMVIYGFCTWEGITFIPLAIFTACEMGSCPSLSTLHNVSVVLCNKTATCNRARVEINCQSMDQSIGRKMAGIAVINHFSHFRAKITKNAENSVVTTSLFILYIFTQHFYRLQSKFLSVGRVKFYLCSVSHDTLHVE